MKVHPSVKLLQTQGLGSRKECENIFWNSEIFRNGERLDPEIDQINHGDTLQIDGVSYQMQPHVYLMMNKPAGYETSHKPALHPSIFDLLPVHYVRRGIQAAGRLDVDTTGLIVLSDDGQFIHKLISGKKGVKHEVEKIYEIHTADPMNSKGYEKLLEGVMLHDETEPVKASRIEPIDDHCFRMGITTGKYHQVKRMVAALGNRVSKLHRASVGPYVLPESLGESGFQEIDPMLF